MRKLLTIENTPANKSEVVKEVCKILGKTAIWTAVGSIAITFFGGVVLGAIEERNRMKLEEEKNS